MTENPLEYEKISKLLKDFAIPSIMASVSNIGCYISQITDPLTNKNLIHNIVD